MRAGKVTEPVTNILSGDGDAVTVTALVTPEHLPVKPRRIKAVVGERLGPRRPQHRRVVLSGAAIDAAFAGLVSVLRTRRPRCPS